jgi:hypothetical protein
VLPLDHAMTEIAAEMARRPDRGEVASYIPELARQAPKAFGLTLIDADGNVAAAGDSDIQPASALRPRRELGSRPPCWRYRVRIAVRDHVLIAKNGREGLDPSRSLRDGYVRFRDLLAPRVMSSASVFV